ncbi:MAG: CBS domain-containing protein [Chloroflexi bacterium]|nr:CBS domain-containing protein [Chloroflexota bacterium]
MYVRDIMVTEFHCASPGEKLSDIAQAMKRHNVGAIPVCDNGRLIGIITDRDIAIECASSGLDPQKCEVKEFMTVSPLAVHPGLDLREAAELMGREQVRRLPVVEGGKLVGMISLGDLAFHLGDDAAVADLLRRISTPIRAMAAGR